VCAAKNATFEYGDLAKASWEPPVPTGTKPADTVPLARAAAATSAWPETHSMDSKRALRAWNPASETKSRVATAAPVQVRAAENQKVMEGEAVMRARSFEAIA